MEGGGGGLELIEAGGLFGRGGLFNVEIHKEVEYGVEKLKYKTF